MMKHRDSVHLKVQEFVDCFATTDPLKEMSAITADSETKEAALKWLALAAIHGINAGAERISLRISGDGKSHVEAKYREAELPSPGNRIGTEVLELVRKIAHLDTGEGTLPFSLGIRDDSLLLNVVVGREGGEPYLRLEFPLPEKRNAGGNPAELEFCTTAPDPEHHRAWDDDEPCYDGTEGKID
jgi:hypothetical protein